MPRDLEITRESESDLNHHQSASNWPKLSQLVSISSREMSTSPSIYLWKALRWHLPPGGLWKFTSGGCRWHRLPSAHAGPRCPSRGSAGCVGSSISGTRGLDPASSSRGRDNGQTSAWCSAGCHGAYWSHGFDWSPQREGGLAVAPQPIALSHTFSARQATAVECQQIFIFMALGE